MIMNKAILLLAVCVLFLPGRAHADESREFWNEIQEVISQAVNSHKNNLNREKGFYCEPSRKASGIMQQIARDEEASLIAWGFAEELAGALDTVLARGGFGKASKIVELTNDVVFSESVDEFVKTRMLKKLSEKLDDQGVNEIIRDKIKDTLNNHYDDLREHVDENIISLEEINRQAAEYQKIKRIFNTHGGAVKTVTLDKSRSNICHSGDAEETFTVTLDAKRLIAGIKLEGSCPCLCQCGQTINRRYPSSYFGLVVARMIPRRDSDGVEWNLVHKRSAFWGYCCGVNKEVLNKRWRIQYPMLRNNCQIGQSSGEAPEEEEWAGPDCQAIKKEFFELDQEYRELHWLWTQHQAPADLSDDARMAIEDALADQLDDIEGDMRDLRVRLYDVFNYFSVRNQVRGYCTDLIEQGQDQRLMELYRRWFKIFELGQQPTPPDSPPDTQGALRLQSTTSETAQQCVFGQDPVLAEEPGELADGVHLAFGGTNPTVCGDESCLHRDYGGIQASVDPLTFRVSGRLPRAPNGTMVHVSLTGFTDIDDYDTPRPEIAFFQTRVDDQKFLAILRYSPDDETLGEMRYRAQVKLWVNNQRYAIAQYLRDHGYPNDQYVIGCAEMAIGSPEQQLEFKRKFLLKARGFYNELLVLTREAERLTSTPIEQNEGWEASFEAYKGRFRPFSDRWHEYHNQHPTWGEYHVESTLSYYISAVSFGISKYRRGQHDRAQRIFADVKTGIETMISTIDEKLEKVDQLQGVTS